MDGWNHPQADERMNPPPTPSFTTEKDFHTSVPLRSRLMTPRLSAALAKYCSSSTPPPPPSPALPPSASPPVRAASAVRKLIAGRGVAGFFRWMLA
jgi:hypothetical protein